jgi:hypothetical protein
MQDRIDKIQNVTFGSHEPGAKYEEKAFVDEMRKSRDNTDATLQDFLSRPVMVQKVSWSTGGVFYRKFNPWLEYFSDPAASNRLNNFNMIRANLHMRFFVNGNPFLYGRAIAGYNPLDAYDNVSGIKVTDDEVTVELSQRPHVWLNPTNSEGGDLIVPFMYHLDYASIALSNLEELGSVVIYPTVPLKHATGSNESVRITVYAWMEDVELTGLTSIDSSTLVPQSGEDEIDEANKDGIVSGPASTVARFAKALSPIPWLRPYAMATSSVADGLASAARLFGYSRPPVTAAPTPMRPTTIGSLALCTTPDTADKLTVDDKQELTIDPRISGVDSNVDPMDISTIAKRSSYLTNFTWPTGAQPDTLLFNIRVSPVVWSEEAAVPIKFRFPPCAAAALPFKYWNGTMNYRFQVVSSKFHRGRLRLTYDPNFNSSSVTNTNYSRIVDISEETDFTVSISNNQPTSLLTHHLPGEDSATEVYSTTEYISIDSGNGVLGVYVLNDLAVPDTTVDNDITINVFVSASDDFEVFVPDDHFQRFMLYPQSGESDGLYMEQNCPVHQKAIRLGLESDKGNRLSSVYTGERIVSFRPLLKRYNLHHSIGVLTDTFYSIYARRNAFPFCRGYVSGAIHSTDTAASYNFCNTVLLHWVTWMHAGMRGSTRWKLLLCNRLESDEEFTAYVNRVHAKGTNNYFEDNSAAVQNYSNNSKVSHDSVIKGIFTNAWKFGPPSGTLGSTFRFGSVNPSVEFEMPFYSLYRFLPCKYSNWTTHINDVNVYDRSPEMWEFRSVVDGNTTTKFDCHVSAGEDFQVYFFTGMPALAYEAEPPTPEA